MNFKNRLIERNTKRITQLEKEAARKDARIAYLEKETRKVPLLPFPVR